MFNVEKDKDIIKKEKADWIKKNLYLLCLVSYAGSMYHANNGSRILCSHVILEKCILCFKLCLSALIA